MAWLSSGRSHAELIQNLYRNIFKENYRFSLRFNFVSNILKKEVLLKRLR